MQKRLFSWLVCGLAGWVHKELRWWTDQLSSNAKQSVPSCCQSSSSSSSESVSSQHVLLGSCLMLVTRRVDKKREKYKQTTNSQFAQKIYPLSIDRRSSASPNRLGCNLTSLLLTAHRRYHIATVHCSIPITTTYCTQSLLRICDPPTQSTLLFS